MKPIGLTLVSSLFYGLNSNRKSHTCEHNIKSCLKYMNNNTTFSLNDYLSYICVFNWIRFVYILSVLLFQSSFQFYPGKKIKAKGYVNVNGIQNTEISLVAVS